MDWPPRLRSLGNN
ncbi:hypothetical protein RDABS01_035856 [Bienertia sinuspersici]